MTKPLGLELGTVSHVGGLVEVMIVVVAMVYDF